MSAFGWSGAATSLWSFYFLQGFYFLIVMILIVDAAIQARRIKNYELKKYNRWYVYIGLFILLVFLINALMSFKPYIFGFDNRRNVSANMAPTLKPSELIVADTRGNLFGFNLKREDIITFIYPMNPSVTYVKRIIGLPGDRVKIQDGVTYINDAPKNELYVSNTSKERSYSTEMKEITVPPGSLFVLGDNRDNSNDSRIWGFLPQSNVQGIVTAIWYSPEKGRIRSGISKSNLE